MERHFAVAAGDVGRGRSRDRRLLRGEARRGAAEGLSWGDLPGLRGGGGKSSKQLILSEVHGYE